MPSVIYVYVGNEGVPPVQCAYLQYCHGGFELRRDPTPYLDSADLYTAITYPSTYDARPTQSQIDTLIIHMETPPSARPNLYNTLNCDFFNTDNTRIGLRWTDYATPEKSCSGTRSTYDSRLQRMMYGSSLIKTLPEITGKRVIALFRAHQHHSSMQPILEPSNGGLYILHKNPGCTSRPDADFPIPIVTTVASSELYQMPCFVEYHHKTQKLIHHFMPDYRPDNTRSLWQTRTGPLHSWKNLRENGLPPRPRPMYKIHSQLFDESYYIPSS